MFSNKMEKGCIMLLKNAESSGFIKWSPSMYNIPVIIFCTLCTITLKNSKMKMMKKFIKILRTPKTSLQNRCKITSDLE